MRRVIAAPQHPPIVDAWAPFRHRWFAVIWVATVVSNIGGWMYSVASGWLMTSLDPDPLIVSMVQVANSLPMFLFAIPAGALVDIVDQRRFLILGESAVMITSTAFAALVWMHLITPTGLIVLSFIVTVGSAMTFPAWQAVVPQLVPKSELRPAVAANSVGINVSRAVGPALGGLLIGALGIAVPFWLNAFSNAGVIAALLWWRPPRTRAADLPPEAFGNAVLTGMRHARYNRHLSATLLRASGFFLFASAYWALLPLVARSQIAGGAALYGLLLGVIGAAAVGGAFLLRILNAKWGANGLAAGASMATSVAMALFARRSRARDSDRSQRHRRRIVDRRGVDPECLGASRIARLGSRSRACDIRDGHVRCPDPRQRAVGRVGRSRRGTGCLVCRGRGHDDRNSPQPAVEVADRGRSGFFTVHALGGPGHVAGGRTGPGTRIGDD